MSTPRRKQANWQPRSTTWCALLLGIFMCTTATSQADARPDLNGVWVTVLVAFDDPRWRIADLVCARTGCSVEGYEYLQSLLAQPESATRKTSELVAEMEDYQRRVNDQLLTPLARQRQEEFDPSEEASLDCQPDGDGLRHQILAPLPMEFEQHDDHVVIRYEYWNAERVIRLDQATPPADAQPSRLGSSVGRYAGSTLWVETTHILPAVTGVPNDKPLMLSADARAVERYTLAEDGESLEMILEIIDPSNFTRAFQNHRRMLRAPGWELDEFICESLTGTY